MQSSNQCIGMLGFTDADADVIYQSRLIEVAHEDAIFLSQGLFQPGRLVSAFGVMAVGW